jgi:hypothetical protein
MTRKRIRVIEDRIKAVMDGPPGQCLPVILTIFGGKGAEADGTMQKEDSALIKEGKTSDG